MDKRTEKRKTPEIQLYQNKTVCESHLFEMIVLNDLSPKQIKILMLLASQICEEDKEFKTYQIPMQKLCEIFCKNTRDKDSIESIKRALVDMRSKTITFIYHLNEDGVEHKVNEITGWINKVQIIDDKIVYFQMASWLELFFINIPKKQRVIYKITYLFNLKRKGAINIYRWAYGNSGFNNPVNISIENAKIYFSGDPNKPTRNFVRDYLEAGVQEINEKTDLHIEYKLNRKAEKGAYSSITFLIDKVKNKGSKLPDYFEQEKDGIVSLSEEEKEQMLIEEMFNRDRNNNADIDSYKEDNFEENYVEEAIHEDIEIPVYNLFD